MKILSFVSVVTLFATAVSAQLTVGVTSTNDSGFALESAAGSRVVRTRAANAPLLQSSILFHREQNPYTYLGSHVHPPVVTNGRLLNRVLITSNARTDKGAGHRSLHTSGDRQGNPGSQRYRIDVSSPVATTVRLKYSMNGRLDDSSSVALRFQLQQTATKAWTLNANGFHQDAGEVVFPLAANGAISVDVAIQGRTVPGSGSDPRAFYDGYMASLWLEFEEVGAGSFTPFGLGCSAATIGAGGVPKKGDWFDLTLTGASPNRPCGLLLGTSNTQFWSYPLPLDLGPLVGATGCFLNVSFFYPGEYVTDASGAATASFWIPPFALAPTYAQWAILDPSAPGGLLMTRGAELRY